MLIHDTALIILWVCLAVCAVLALALYLARRMAPLVRISLGGALAFMGVLGLAATVVALLSS